MDRSYVKFNKRLLLNYIKINPFPNCSIFYKFELDIVFTHTKISVLEIVSKLSI